MAKNNQNKQPKYNAKRLHNAVIAAYDLGYQNGKARGQRTIRVLCDELHRLDEDEPRVGVLISLKFASRLIKNAKGKTKNYLLANKLAAMTKATRERDSEMLLKAIEEAWPE